MSRIGLGIDLPARGTPFPGYGPPGSAGGGGGGGAASFSLETAAFVASYPLASLINGQEINVSSDGMHVYVLDAVTDGIRQYDLSTAFDFSTMSANGATDFIPTETNAYHFHISSDGVYVYIGGIAGDTIFQYELTTPWDINGGHTLVGSLDYAALADAEPSVGLGTGNMDISNDGKHVIFSDSPEIVSYYTLGTAWDIGTVTDATYVGALNTTTVIGFSISLEDIKYNEDGTKVFALSSSNVVYELDLSTPYDVTTATYSGFSLDMSSQDADIDAIDVLDGGNGIVSTGSNDDDLNLYQEA